MVLLLVIVADFNIVRVAITESEADSPLIIDRDRVLSLAVVLQRVQPISGWNPEIVEARREVNVLELTHCATCKVRRKAPG